MSVLAICGIDTDIGKSVATGLLGRFLLQQNQTVISMKPVQTGSREADDIRCHRKIMQMAWTDDDEAGHTCPYCFPFAGSPHLAASLAGKRVEVHLVQQNLEILKNRYDWVLLEGVGGLLVPLAEDLLFLDFLVQLAAPLVLVTSPRLGSINHTLLSLEAISRRKLDLRGLIYNLHGDHPREIISDSLQIFRRALTTSFPGREVVIMPQMAESRATNWTSLLESSPSSSCP